MISGPSDKKQCFQSRTLALVNVHFISALKEARNSFFGLGVYLLKPKFRMEDKLRFP